MAPKNAQKTGPQKPLSARGVALAVLGRILSRKQPLDDAIRATGGGESLSVPDRAFARALVATSLRRLGQIDAVITHCLDRPLPDAARGTTNALRLGLAQLLFLGVPAHAAVSETVDLVRDGRFRGLVNAVLRRTAREGQAMLSGQDAARLNTPDWLWDSWTGAYGEAAARAIAEAHLAEPPLDVVLKPGLDAETWAERLEASLLPTGILRRPVGGRIEDLPGYAEGAWWVQDAAATLPVRLLDVSAGETVADLCAAPGGKTAQLASMEAEVIALDRSNSRLDRLRETLARLKFEARIVVADAATWTPDEPISKILLDAPCSATGTVRRHPDLPHIKSADDIPGLTAAQDKLLAHAAEILAPGGILLYCVCSLEPAEGEDRVAALLSSNPAMRRRPIRAKELPGLDEAITPEGDVRTLPCHWAEYGGLDGFFIARLEKAS